MRWIADDLPAEGGNMTQSKIPDIRKEEVDADVQKVFHRERV